MAIFRLIHQSGLENGLLDIDKLSRIRKSYRGNGFILKHPNVLCFRAEQQYIEYNGEKYSFIVYIVHMRYSHHD